ncbi:hypothetical protein [Domibacillus aminovorans]|uniref:Uncharacterized protein n=1 Tax=Domibacillus aminovorans TaxID=29332 RepID=A0A177KZW6_9BACI|nr:hypothetical protein [Domibacillus aminovorans]OAH58979.1 hypothetical protein AWH49_04765 [Domibacillus aminovorans]
MNDTKQMVMSINQPYEEGENDLKTVTFIQKCSIAWHKYHYLKYQYLEEGCINKKIKKELEEKKIHHYKKYTDIS